MSRPPRPVPPLLLSLPCVTAPSVLKRAGAVVSSCIEVVQSRPSFDPPNGGARSGGKGDAKGRACKLVGGDHAAAGIAHRHSARPSTVLGKRLRTDQEVARTSMSARSVRNGSESDVRNGSGGKFRGCGAQTDESAH